MKPETKALQEFLLNIIRQVAIVDLPAMEELYDASMYSLSMQDNLVSLVDPSRWMRQREDGTQQSAELQAKMLKHLIAIRKLAGELQDLSEEVAARQFARQESHNVTVSRETMERLLAEGTLTEEDFITTE